MPFGVNNQNLFNNTQFQQFVEFANTSKAGDIAKMSLSPGGKEHSITATSESFIGKLFRSSETKEANNYARTIFKESIAKMFGGEDHIPDSVKDAMKMNDFGKGRPLTARRIMAVKAAIDQVADKMKTCVEESKADFNYTMDGQEKCDEMIEKAFIACKGNTDAMDIVKTHIGEITVNSVSELRTEEGMQKKVDGLLDNLSELKELSKKNPAIYAAGKQMLKESGVALPKGMITKLVQASNEAPINWLRKFSGSSPATSIHDVTVQMYKSIKHAMTSSGAEKMETPERMAARDFIASTILSRCSKSALQNIRSALDTEDAACLQEYYSITEGGGNVHVEDESEAVQETVKTTGTIGTNYLEILDINVNRNLDRLEPNVSHNSRIQSYDKQVDVNEIGGKALIDRTIGLAKEINEELAQNLIDKTVQGKGQGADTFKAILKKKLGDSSNPSEFLSQRLSENSGAMMNWTICGEMRKLATGEKITQFEKDIDRSGKITLTNGDKTITLSKKFETARDQLAQFIKGDEKATYGALLPEDKNQVHLMMSMISQETEKAGENGVQHALHPRESEDEYLVSGSKFDKGTRTFAFEKTSSGSISFKYNMDKSIVDIRPGDSVDEIPVGEGSAFKCSMEYTLSATEFKRVANLDYTKFEDKEADKIVNDKQQMPDGTKQFAEGKMMKAVDTFSQEFKIDARCSVSFSMTLNPSDEEMINETRQ